MTANSTELFHSASSFLAAERTFLAWVRTCLALVGFGVAFARIGGGVGMVFGICTILLGSVFLANSTWRYFEVTHLMLNSKFEIDRTGVIVASASCILLILAAIGIVIFSHCKDQQDHARRRSGPRQKKARGGRGGRGDRGDRAGDDYRPLRGFETGASTPASSSSSPQRVTTARRNISNRGGSAGKSINGGGGEEEVYEYATSPDEELAGSLGLRGGLLSTIE
jgi:putative membrane protein